MSKSKKNVAPKSDMRGHNKGPENVPTLEGIVSLFQKAEEAQTKSDLARYDYRAAAIMFACANAGEAIMERWIKEYEAIRSEGSDAEARKLRNDAREYFAHAFHVGTLPEGAKGTEKRTRDGKVQRIIDDVAVACAVVKAKAANAFEYEAGVLTVDRATAFGEKLWIAIGGNKKESLMKRTLRGTPVIYVRAKSNQAADGECDWQTLATRLLVEAKWRTERTGNDRRRTSNPNKPGDTLDHVASIVSANVASAERHNDGTAEGEKEGKATLLIASNVEIARAINAVDRILKATCRGPIFARGWEHVEKGFALWRDIVGAAKAPTTTTTTTTNNNVVEIKRDVTTPPEAKALPAGTPARSLPHPANPANNKVKTGK